MNQIKTRTYAEALAEQKARNAAARAEAEGSPYTVLFRAAVEMPDTSGGATCMRLLLGLYNGGRFKFDLTDLRRLDAGLHGAALAAMADEVGCARYVHERIAGETGFPAEAIQAKLEWLAYDHGVPGRAKKVLMPERPGNFDFISQN